MKDMLKYVVDGVEEGDCEATQHEKHITDGNVDVKDGDVTVDHEVLQATCGTDLSASSTSTLSIFNINSSHHNNNKSPTSRHSTLKKSSTASSLKSKGDFQLDRKSIAKFINQQTTFLGNSKYICNLCRQEFKQLKGNKGLRKHVHVHSSWIRANTKNASQCDICFKKLSTPGMLERHMKMHEDLFCNSCQEVFNSKSSLFRHRLSYKLRVYACGVDACHKTFLTHRRLFTHMANVHKNVTQPKYKCGNCSTEYNNLDILRRHIQMTGHGAGNCCRVNSGGGDGVSSSSASGDTNIITLPNGLRIKFEGMVNE